MGMILNHSNMVGQWTYMYFNFIWFVNLYWICHLAAFKIICLKFLEDYYDGIHQSINMPITKQRHTIKCPYCEKTYNQMFMIWPTFKLIPMTKCPTWKQCVWFFLKHKIKIIYFMFGYECRLSILTGNRCLVVGVEHKSVYNSP